MTPATAQRLARAVRLLGWALLALGLFLLVREMYTLGAVAEGRRMFLWIDVGLCVVGLWFIAPTQAGELITRVGTYLPAIGGRRAADRDITEQVHVVASTLPPDQHAQAVVEEIIGKSAVPLPQTPPEGDTP